MGKVNKIIQEREEKIKAVKKHLCSGGLYGDFEEPDNVFEFVRNNVNEFEDVVFLKTRDIASLEELRKKRKRY